MGSLLCPAPTTSGSRTAAWLLGTIQVLLQPAHKGRLKKLLLLFHELVINAAFELTGFSALLVKTEAGGGEQKLASSLLQHRTSCFPSICLVVEKAFSRVYASKGRKLKWSSWPQKILTAKKHHLIFKHLIS